MNAIRKPELARTLLLCSLAFPLAASVSAGSPRPAVQLRQGLWLLHSRRLRITFAPHSLTVTVRELHGCTWKMQPNGAHDLQIRLHGALRWLRLRPAAVVPVRVGSWQGIEVRPLHAGLRIQLLLLRAKDELRFRLIPAPGNPVIALQYPRPFLLPASASSYSVVPIQEGFLLPGNYPQALRIGSWQQGGVLGLQMAYQKLSMPWWGQVNGHSAVMAFMNTPDDATIRLRHAPGGPSRLSTLWLPSLGKLRYPREVTYIFRRHWGYVAMVRWFRHWMRHHVAWRILAQKAQRIPALHHFPGAVHINAMGVVHLSTAHYDHINSFTQIGDWLQQARNKYGLRQAVFQLYGWSAHGADNSWPDSLPPNSAAGGVHGLQALGRLTHQLGFQFWLHVDFDDIYANGKDFSPRILIRDQNGHWPRVAAWAGGRSSYISIAQAMPFIVRDMQRGYDGSPGIVHLGPPDGVFLDTYPTDFETFGPPSISRSQWRRILLHQLRYFSGLGLEISVEGSEWYAMPYVDDLWSTQLAGFPAYTPKLRYGFGIPVPLFNLAFHDMVLIGFAVNRKQYYPLASPRTLFLYGLLWGDMLNIPLNHSRYVPVSGNSVYLTDTSPRAQTIIRQELLLARLGRCLGFSRMLNHRFLGRSFELQETTFSSGVSVWANLGNGQFRIRGCPAISARLRVAKVPATWAEEQAPRRAQTGPYARTRPSRRNPAPPR